MVEALSAHAGATLEEKVQTKVQQMVSAFNKSNFLQNIIDE